MNRVNQKGLTLIELMFALAISTVLLGGMYGLYRVQSTTTTYQMQVSEMQQNLRAGIDHLIRIIRMAGYDPEGSGDYTVTAANSTAVSFTRCEEQTDGSCNTITYHIHLTGDQELLCTDGGEPVAENVEKIDLHYTMKDSTQTPTPTGGKLDEIRAIDVSLLVKAKKEANKFKNTKAYTYRKNKKSWGPFNDQYRRRLLSREITMRNMGL